MNELKCRGVYDFISQIGWAYFWWSLGGKICKLGVFGVPTSDILLNRRLIITILAIRSVKNKVSTQRVDPDKARLMIL